MSLSKLIILHLPFLGHAEPRIQLSVDRSLRGQTLTSASGIDSSTLLQSLVEKRLITATGNIKMRVLLLHISSFPSYARALLLHLYSHRLSRDRTGIRLSKAKAFG